MLALRNRASLLVDMLEGTICETKRRLATVSFPSTLVPQPGPVPICVLEDYLFSCIVFWLFSFLSFPCFVFFSSPSFLSQAQVPRVFEASLTSVLAVAHAMAPHAGLASILLPVNQHVRLSWYKGLLREGPAPHKRC